MAELHLEHKHRTTWPWILAGVLLLALVLWLVFGRGERAGGDVADLTPPLGPAVTAPAATVGDGSMPEAVSEYLGYVEANRAAPATGVAHEYAADGLRRLAAALGAVVEGDTVSAVAVEPRLAELRERADAVQRNPEATNHALLASEAFVMAAALTTQIQQSAYPALAAEASEVRDAAAAITGDRPLLDQTAEVQRFFDRAAAALRGMTAGATTT